MENYKLEISSSSDLERHPTVIERDRLHQLQHIHTVGSNKPSELTYRPPFGRGRPYPPPLQQPEGYLVEFESHDDPQHPQNWPIRRKVGISAILIATSFAATLASSILSPASVYLEREFHVGAEVTTLGTSLFVLGYACGPPVFAPMSELYGRRLPIFLATLGLGLFGVGCATAENYQTLMLCRFFAGVFGACPLVVVPAVFADMYDSEVRGLAIACFSATVMCGPFTGPFIGGFIAKSYLGWRWTQYIPAFLALAAGIAALIWQKETFPPVILVHKARKLRRLTRNWAVHARQEEVEINLKELASKNLSRPFYMLLTEPILLLVTLYVSFIYGLLFLSLLAYDIIFGEIHEFSLGVSGLPFLAAVVGIGVGIIVITSTNWRYIRKLRANNGIAVPEWRLPLVLIGGVLFAIGLFWLGWAGYKRSTHWIVPTLSGSFLGFGIYTIFLQCTNYIIDTYVSFAASAVAANTIVRSVVAAVFPLFAKYMFASLGVQWSMTMLGCIAVIFIPLPLVFLLRGQYIREHSRSSVRL